MTSKELEERAKIMRVKQVLRELSDGRYEVLIIKDVKYTSDGIMVFVK